MSVCELLLSVRRSVERGYCNVPPARSSTLCPGKLENRYRLNCFGFEPLPCILRYDDKTGNFTPTCWTWFLAACPIYARQRVETDVLLFAYPL